MTANGSYVTRAELAAHLEPMKEDITEMRQDVKTLLSESAKAQAVFRIRSSWTAAIVAFAAAIFGTAVGASVWAFWP